MPRSTNAEIIQEFRTLLTEGARARFAGVNVHPHNTNLLELTKAWRADLWNKLKECEERMCPQPPRKPDGE